MHGNATFDSLIERVGEVKVELATVTYRARPLIKIAKDIKGKKVSPIIEETISSLETLRITLINPYMNDEMLSKDILSLRKSFEKLQSTLSQTEHL